MFTQICQIENLYAAWRKVRTNGGASGVDAVSIKEFEKNLQDNLNELSRNLRGGDYQPLPAKFVSVMKANGKMRELGILTVRDRTAQRAVLDAIEADIETEMQDCNFAFRAGRNVEMAIQQIIASRANGFWWTVEADIENYFPAINRDVLMKDVRKIVADERVQNLIGLWLNAGILEETWWRKSGRKIAEANTILTEAAAESLENLIAHRTGENQDFGADFSSEFEDEESLSPFEAEKLEKRKKREAVKGILKEGFWLAMAHRAVIGQIFGAKSLGIGGAAIVAAALAPTVVEFYRQRFHPRRGILQGSPLSPVLANLYLTEFDRKFMQSGAKLVRYCDDFVILCRTKAEAKAALQTARNELAKRHLALHPEKTRILAPTDEFEFLGYKFLSNGLVEPPPSATAEMARKIRAMSKRARSKFKDSSSKMKVEKLKFNSWRDFFDKFGNRD